MPLLPINQPFEVLSDEIIVESIAEGLNNKDYNMAVKYIDEAIRRNP